MSLKKVYLTHDALHCCITHALATERQEVMGLLLGSWGSNEFGEHVEAHVRQVVVMTRTDRRKDRVEVGYEQLADAAVLAADITAQTGVETRVIGWVHSHPHITVLPSHVDVRTQMQYQQMDQGFLGLIFAVFQDDAKSGVGRIEVTAFQSMEAVAHNQEAVQIIHDDDGLGGHVEIPVYDASAAAAGGFVRKGIPITLKSNEEASHDGEGAEEVSTFNPITDAMRCVVSLQEVLMREERLCYEAATGLTRRNAAAVHGEKKGDVHALYNSAVYSKALASLMEESALPLVNTLESILENLKWKKTKVMKKNQVLEDRLNQGSDQRRERYERELQAEEVAAADKKAAMDLDRYEAGGGGGMDSSRPTIFDAARKGQLMEMIGGGKKILVSLHREYPSHSNGFGVWRLHIGDSIKGILKKITSEEGNAHIKFYVHIEGATYPSEYTFVPTNDSVDLWVKKIQPIISCTV